MASKDLSEKMHQLITSSKQPLIFKNVIKTSWPMLDYAASDWNALFGERILECRVGVRDSTTAHEPQIEPKGNPVLIPEPQWEAQSPTVECTYSQLIKWNTGDIGKPNECHGGGLSGLYPEKHFLYFAYKHMKDFFEPAVMKMIDWEAFGFPGRNGSESTFWLGTAGAHTPCHFDTYGCNLVAQITGRKRWILYPPEDTSFLEPTRVPYEESSVYSRINFEKWSYEVIPNVAGTHPHVVELHPGDVLFVPRHWWHHVQNLELSISINIWLERPEDDEARFHESLVKFLVAHTSRNLQIDMLQNLLNPNEEDVVVTDLAEIQGYISSSFQKLEDAKLLDSSATQEKEEENYFSEETRIVPVVCSHFPGISVEPINKKSRPSPNTSELSSLDVIRAFCHPRVIDVVAQILRESSSASLSHD